MWEASTAVYLGVVKRLKKFGEWFKLTIRLALARQKESTNHNEYVAVYGIRMRYIYKLFKRCCKTYIKEIQGRPTPDVKFYWKKNKFIRGFKNYRCLYFALFGELRYSKRVFWAFTARVWFYSTSGRELSARQGDWSRKEYTLCLATRQSTTRLFITSILKIIVEWKVSVAWINKI